MTYQEVTSRLALAWHSHQVSGLLSCTFHLSRLYLSLGQGGADAHPNVPPACRPKA